MQRNGYKKTFDQVLRRLRRYSPKSDTGLLQRAYDFGVDAHRDQLRKSGEPYFVHCLEVAKILTELKMDSATIAGGLLHDVVEDTGIDIAEVEEKFGVEVALLVDGVTKISELRFDSLEERQAENFRKMIISMVQDIRVILIKFADRLHNMKTIEYLPQRKRERIAIETRDVYAPLAHRLGIAKIKWELEDLVLKTLEPDTYWDLVRKVTDSREARERYIRKVTAPIRKELKNLNINAKIAGRPKHFYSIYGKMRARKVPIEQIYDLLAIRVIVDRVEECYFVLGIVHNLYTPVHERFKDYIATPKSNFYQSLHTTVIGPDGKMVEIQIRTDDMHRTAEEGIAAHWLYKEGKNKQDELDKQLSWLRQVLEWQQETKDPSEFMENLRIELFRDEVFVFTPKGDLLKLPVNSTPVDFAFAVHTDIGYHCIGAKVNGKMVPLSYELKSGDSVEIITSPNQKPNPDWIKFVKSSKARSKIRRWLKESFYEQSLKLGEEIVEKEFKRYNLKREDIDLNEIAQTLNFQNAEQLFAAIGRGDTSVHSVINRIAPDKNLEVKQSSLFQKFIHKARGRAKGVRVQGLDNLMITFGRCCQPVPGDNILGFITKGRGIVIHRTDCKNIPHLMEHPERKIDVEWDVDKDKHFMVRLQLFGEDRKNFLLDVSQSISQTDTNIVSIEMKAEDTFVQSTIIIEVRNLQHLTKIINKISQVKGVINVERLNGTAASTS
ncbi:bifunctional (p)ppGpp synthetase/guanosine-3',5'-bis(diphosphate) 3'-pyrophosphohydrolase [candidate division KSB1 bacterium]|nr:bifunctional (p)ppGpp synthetase/guanosine-3',5'-bis(diphosphate) 3'-pyrophosphohydrolase [candidate division KSB1 bacterium]NIR72261.1 bifunctional (p)ppGpp synthetase/guanosine-3',5'-bis(diphosphate) 3'-pyrophosphohydrolase [candidate division KSB1 bacterium]NIS24232.1 bifunctional (p)ppGpp synthetase/guanosine-3',5'-bis(diphosphate) 3'-pyrophosphohydrolase [candidate division KSB1 bacterium]NIT71146.1 bifunctional (p)ppGpp synthetase/guanosine-3',5'-bis(diphosphate) 3'-pyrophosphohydrolase